METLTKQAVLDTAKELIEDDGYTTTLAVKRKLRENGYFAKQRQVSNFLQDLARDFILCWTFNGLYRKYTLDPNADSIDDVVDDIPTGITIGYQKRNGKVIKDLTYADIVNESHMIVFSKLYSDVLYFPLSYTRSEVRFAYSKLTGIPYKDTRIKTIKVK